MNILIDKLPESVQIDGVEYPISFGFRAIILCEICIFDTKLTEEQRTLNALNIFYMEHIPTDLDKAMELFLWFYLCGKKKKDSKPTIGGKSSKRCYDFEQDADLIYSAYKTQYGVDLNGISSNELHWWKFRAMFKGLGEELKLCKIMGYRVADLSGLDKKQKAFYNSMKKQYALKDEIQVADKMKLTKRDNQLLNYVQQRFKGVANEKS